VLKLTYYYFYYLFITPEGSKIKYIRQNVFVFAMCTYRYVHVVVYKTSKKNTNP